MIAWGCRWSSLLPCLYPMAASHDLCISRVWNLLMFIVHHRPSSMIIEVCLVEMVACITLRSCMRRSSIWTPTIAFDSHDSIVTESYSTVKLTFYCCSWVLRIFYVCSHNILLMSSSIDFTTFLRYLWLFIVISYLSF